MAASGRAQIDRARLRAHVQRLAGAPRPAGTAAHRKAAEFIERELVALGLAVRRDAFSGQGYAGTNLVAEPPGSDAADKPLFVLGAHYDSVPGSPGADDNATGVAVLLEVAR